MIEVTCPGCNKDIKLERFDEGQICPECKCIIDMEHECVWDKDTDDSYCYDYPLLAKVNV